MTSYSAHATAMLVVSSLGFGANSLSAFIWLFQLKGKSGSFFLGCLCIVDALSCLTRAVVTGRDLTSTKYSCTSGAVYTAAAFFANFSRLLTVAVVAQRVVAVRWPLSVVRLCSTGRQLIVLAVLAVFPLAFLIFDAYVFHLFHVICETPDDSTLPKYALYERLVAISSISDTVWHGLQVIVTASFSGVLLFTACTISEVTTDGQRSSGASVAWHQALQRRLTAMVLCLSTFSLLDISLLIVLKLQVFGYVDLGLSHQSLVKFDLACYWIYVLNCSINFLFYFCFGSEFRLALWKICRNCTRQGRHVCGSDSDRTRTSSEGSNSNQTRSTNVKTDAV